MRLIRVCLAHETENKMRIYDLIHKCSFDEVGEKLKLHYPNADITPYRELYADFLSRCEPANEQNDTFIYITASHPESDTSAETSDDDNTSLSFDVSAYIKNDVTVYSIASMSYAEFLDCFIDESTLERFSPSDILAHCLWEITFYGFEDNE